MQSELVVNSVHHGDYRFEAHTASYTIKTDYSVTPGQRADGFTPLELLVASLNHCAGGAMIALLRRFNQTPNSLEIRARAQRREEHPTVLTEIHLTFVISGEGLDRALVERALSQAEERICPAWAMLKGSTKITTSLELISV